MVYSSRERELTPAERKYVAGVVRGFRKILRRQYSTCPDRLQRRQRVEDYYVGLIHGLDAGHFFSKWG